MKGKLLSRLNKKTIGILIAILTVAYLLLVTVFAQDWSKLTEGTTNINYSKDHLSYGDLWAFDSDAYSQSNYSKNFDGADIKYYNKDESSSNTGSIKRYFYESVTTSAYAAPTGTTMKVHAFTLFNNKTSQGSLPSPADSRMEIPVVEAAQNGALYSVVPDTTGDYYVYAYCETGTPSMKYTLLNSCQALNGYSGAPGTALQFEAVGNNWYRAPVTVDTVTWYAVALEHATSTSSGSGVGTYNGGRRPDLSLNNKYYNQWSYKEVHYNTVLVFQFDTDVKLGPVAKSGDSFTVTNADPAKGTVTAKSIFGKEITVGNAALLDHCPVIISAGSESYMVDEVRTTKGNGKVEPLGKDYIYNFEDTSELSVTWTKLVDLPTITVTGGASDVSMNFFAAKRAAITHPAGDDKVYTFTADFSGASDLAKLEYAYTFDGAQAGAGTLTDTANSFSVPDVCYGKVEVVFTAESTDGDIYNAYCTINLSEADITSPFRVDKSYYHTWEKAVAAAAASSSKTVILNSDYTLPDSLFGNGLAADGSYVKASGDRVNYILPSGVTFIVPYADGVSSVNSGSDDHPYACELQGGYNAQNPIAVTEQVYVTLGVSSGASVNLSGVMSVGGNTNTSCTIYSDHGNIFLEEGAEINVQSGAVLSACGYIYGGGTVNAASGSTVYVPFSVIDYRGGGYTVGVAGKMGSSYGLTGFPSGESYLSPFIRYTMNAIQAKLVVNQGASVIGYVNLNARSANHNSNSVIISSSSGLIVMENATLEITYDAGTYAPAYSTVGKTRIKISGDAEFGELELKFNPGIGGDVTINTNKVNFPLPYNFDIEIASGTFSVPNSIMLLPGARVIVNDGAVLDVNASMTVYDGLQDYTCLGDESDKALKGYEKGSGSVPESTFTNTLSPSFVYPSTSVLQGATFGGSGSADLIVNGTLNLGSGAKLGGIIQTESSDNARINVASGVGTSTKTQIGAVGTYSFLTNQYCFVGATVHELKGQIIDTGTGERTDLKAGMTYYPAAGSSNISSYTYDLYYDSAKNYVTVTENSACILNGSWYNYKIPVHTVKDGNIVKTVEMYFADGADVQGRFYTDQACTSPASTISGSVTALYFKTEDAEAKIVWADGREDGYYPDIRNAVHDAVSKGDRIVLLKDLANFGSVIGPEAGQDFIFDMNGHTINYRSSPFTSVGGTITVDVNGGKITNVVDGKHCNSPVLLLNKETYSMTLLLNGGTIDITGTAETPLTNGGVSNIGNLTVDLGGGSWIYRTGISVPKKTSETNANMTHNLDVLTGYRGKAMIENTGTLTIKDSVGGGQLITDLIESDGTFNTATQATNYVSVIRNYAGATLNLDGGKLVLEQKLDADGDPILNNKNPIRLYSAAVLNFGTVKSSGNGSAVSMEVHEGGYCLYNFRDGVVDLDLRGGTVSLAAELGDVADTESPYSKSHYNGKAAVINNGTMRLADSAESGKITTNAASKGGNIAAIRNVPVSGNPAVLTLDGVGVETTQNINNLSYALINSVGGTIQEIKNSNITSKLGYALYSAGNTTTKTDIGDITGSTFTAGTTETVAGTHAVYTTYTQIGNISGSTFKNESTASNITAMSSTGNAAAPITIGDITDSHFEGPVYGFYASYAHIDNINGSTFASGSNYALSAGTNSTIKSITGGRFTSTGSGGLSISGSAENKNTSLSRVIATIGGITGAEFDVNKIGINLSHADIGNLDHVTIKAETGNGINATYGSVIGDITDCEITSGVYDAETGKYTTGAAAISSDGAAATATADVLRSKIGNIIHTTLKAKNYGITNSGGSIIDNITDTTIESGSYGIYSAGRAANAFADGIAPTIGDITGTTINAENYCFSSNGVVANTSGAGAAAKVGIIEDCEFNSIRPAANQHVIITNNSSVVYIKNTPIKVINPAVKTYGIYSSGSDIGSIENCPISAPYGIYNQNTRGDSYTAENGSTIAFYGHIGTIKDTDITVAQNAVVNRGVIDEIIGKCTFKATNPSATVSWDHGSLAPSNASASTVCNYNTWWGTDSLWKRTDDTSSGVLVRTEEYKVEDEFRPTIGKISGDIHIIAENTGNNISYGVALYNAGLIPEISGNVNIETYVHPDNDKITYSQYAIQNSVGGRIDKIEGNVNISAGGNTIQNQTGSTYTKQVTAYAGTTATNGQETSIVRNYYYDYTGIGDIIGDMNGSGIVIEATHQNYAIMNYARMGSITGKVSVTADAGQYAVYNYTYPSASVEYEFTWPEQSKDTGAEKTYHEKYLEAKIGVIGSENSEILISSKNGNTVYNSGTIDAIIGADIRTTTGINNTPTVVLAGATESKDQVYQNLGVNESTGKYDTKITRSYAYIQPSIGRISGVTVTTPVNYALKNAGKIGSVTDSVFTAGTGYGIDNTSCNMQNDGSEYGRHTVHYYNGTTPFATSAQYFGETAIWYTSRPAEIETIDNVTVNVTGGSYGIQNAGIIGSITGSNITVSGSYAIANNKGTTTGEDVSGQENYIYKNDAGSYAVTSAANITDKTWTYAPPKIGSIGAGTVIQAASRTVDNKGIIEEIGSAAGERITVEATDATGSNKQTIWNYQGFITEQERVGSTTTVNTSYASAKIGSIRNVSVINGITAAIQNGDGTANYSPEIGEIGEGTEVYSKGGHAVYNHQSYAKIGKLSGGVFTTEASGNFYALYNASTTNPIELSGGFFRSGTGDRAHAVYEPDNTKAERYIYPTDPDLVLSYGAKNVTLADGTTASGYYFIAENKILITFDPNGALKGEMDQLEISLADPEAAVTLPKNGFSWTGFKFNGWSKEQYAGEGTFNDSWNGTVSELQNLLGQSFLPGEEVVLYAVWTPDESLTYQITWGAMDFTYTRPTFIWNAAETKYEQTNPGEDGWSAAEGSNTISVNVGNSNYEAALTFTPDANYGSLKMLFTDKNGNPIENGTFTIPAGGESVVYAALDGQPDSSAAQKAKVGTVTIELTPVN